MLLSKVRITKSIISHIIVTEEKYSTNVYALITDNCDEKNWKSEKVMVLYLQQSHWKPII